MIQGTRRAWEGGGGGDDEVFCVHTILRGTHCTIKP